MKSHVMYMVGKDGVKWYRCTNCGYLTRGKPQECPVCNGRQIKRGDESENQGKTQPNEH